MVVTITTGISVLKTGELQSGIITSVLCDCGWTRDEVRMYASIEVNFMFPRTSLCTPFALAVLHRFFFCSFNDRLGMRDPCNLEVTPSRNESGY